MNGKSSWRLLEKRNMSQCNESEIWRLNLRNCAQNQKGRKIKNVCIRKAPVKKTKNLKQSRTSLY